MLFLLLFGLELILIDLLLLVVVALVELYILFPGLQDGIF